MTTNPKAKRTRNDAADAADADETATAAATPAVSPPPAHDLAGLDVFTTGDEPPTGAAKVESVDSAEDEQALDATRPRAAAVLLDADAAQHLAGDLAAEPGDPRAVAVPQGDAEYEAGEENEEEDDEGEETVIAQATPRPRTLSAAFRQPREEVPTHEEDAPPDDETMPRDATLPPFPLPLTPALEPESEDVGDAIEDEIDPEEEWAVADQPTIYMPPRRGSGAARSGPAQEGWPYRPQPGQGKGQGQGEGQGRAPTRPRPGFSRPGAGVPLRRVAPIPALRSGYEGPRLASPKGRPMPGTPPDGISPAALADPRMERFQHLRESREAHDHGERTADEGRPVSEIVRQWWGDLLPGLRGALRHQHEAQASGVHPASPYDAAPASKLGDAFGRLAQSARDLTDRARPVLRRFHDNTEHAAQRIVRRFEQPTAVQQAPFLGPGRIAVFFKSGVSVGQAHALLMRRQARPMRLIPRKHGFLAAVAPGREAEICDGLRDHPYIRDVAYIAYDDAGQPMSEESEEEA